MTNEVDEQVELFWRKPDLSPGNENFAGLKVDSEVTLFDHLFVFAGFRRTTQGSSNPSEQFCHTKRFCYIIVSAGVKSFYFGSCFTLTCDSHVIAMLRQAAAQDQSDFLFVVNDEYAFLILHRDSNLPLRSGRRLWNVGHFHWYREPNHHRQPGQ